MRTKRLSNEGTIWNCQKYNKCTSTTITKNKGAKRNHLLTSVVMLNFQNPINETYILKYSNYTVITK